VRVLAVQLARLARPFLRLPDFRNGVGPWARRGRWCRVGLRIVAHRFFPCGPPPPSRERSLSEAGRGGAGLDADSPFGDELGGAFGVGFFSLMQAP
jgi:hypothetical protein